MKVNRADEFFNERMMSEDQHKHGCVLNGKELRGIADQVWSFSSVILSRAYNARTFTRWRGCLISYSIWFECPHRRSLTTSSMFGAGRWLRSRFLGRSGLYYFGLTARQTHGSCQTNGSEHRRAGQ